MTLGFSPQYNVTWIVKSYLNCIVSLNLTVKKASFTYCLPYPLPMGKKLGMGRVQDFVTYPLLPIYPLPIIIFSEVFDNQKMKLAFDPDIFLGLLLKWIVKTDQPFSCVESHYFEQLLGYLEKDITVHSRRTIMRRLEELYLQTKLVIIE